MVICLATYLSTTVLAMGLAALVVGGPAEMPWGGEDGRIAAATRSPVGLAILLFLPQVALAAPAVLAAIVSPLPLAQRLGLVRGNWPIWMWCTAAMATPLVALICFGIAGAVLGESEPLDEMTSLFRSIGEKGFLVPLALMVGVMPGICEELVFRGYVQTRLVSRWGPVFGIFIASAGFALFHMDPVHSVAVFGVGAYLGWMAWTSGSILPAMLAHFLNNFLSVLAVVLLPRSTVDGVPADMEDVPKVAAAVLSSVVLLSAACLAITFFQAVRHHRNRPADISDSVTGPG